MAGPKINGSSGNNDSGNPGDIGGVDGDVIIIERDDNIFDPATADRGSGGERAAGDSNAGSNARKGRRKRTVRASQETSENLTAILFSMHRMLAALTNTAELAIEKEEAKQLAEAIERVERLYTDAIIPESWLAWGNLVSVAGQVYGTRIMAANIRKKSSKARPVSAQVIYDPTVTKTA